MRYKTYTIAAIVKATALLQKVAKYSTSIAPLMRFKPIIFTFVHHRFIHLPTRFTVADCKKFSLFLVLHKKLEAPTIARSGFKTKCAKELKKKPAKITFGSRL
jgi:hypothetical protein